MTRRPIPRRRPFVLVRLEPHHARVIMLALETHEAEAVRNAGGDGNAPPAIAARRAREALARALGAGPTTSLADAINRAYRNRPPQ